MDMTRRYRVFSYVDNTPERFQSNYELFLVNSYIKSVIYFTMSRDSVEGILSLICRDANQSALFRLFSSIVVLDVMGHLRDSTAKYSVLLEWFIR